MRILQFLRRNLIGLLVLVIIVVAVRYAMAKYRRPGSQTVLEGQSMDMTQMVAPPGTVPVAAETVREVEFAPTVTYTGSVVALNDEEVYPRVTGTLVELTVYPGNRVRAGQIIGRLDNVELTSRTNEAEFARQAAQNEIGVSEEEHRQAQAQQRASQAKVLSLQGALRDVQSQRTAGEAMQEQAERELEAAQSSVADAEANVAAMQADVEYWSSEIAREEKLYKARAVSTEEYQREVAQARTATAKLTQAEAAVQEKRALLSAAKAKIRQAAAAVTGAEARLDQVRSDILSAQAEVTANGASVKASQRRIQQRSAMAGQTAAQERTAGIVRGYTELRARQDGVVTERLVSPGTLVQPGMAILRIKNTDRLRLQANVAESDVSGIRIGNPVTVTTQRDPNFRLQTRVTSIFNAANPQSRTVIVEALVSNPGSRLLPGQYVVMQIATAASRRVLTIPQTAVRRDVDQKPYVWVAADGQEGKPVAKRVNITLGAADGQRVVVTSGLPPGDKVVYAGHEYLNEGDILTLTEWTAQGPKTLPEGSGQMAPMPGMDMGNMGGMKMDEKSDKEPMPGMDHTGGGQQKQPERDHGRMPGMNNNTMPEMNHNGGPSGGSDRKPSMPGMDHTDMPGKGGR